jgi:hypothetical protein
MLSSSSPLTSSQPATFTPSNSPSTSSQLGGVGLSGVSSPSGSSSLSNPPSPRRSLNSSMADETAVPASLQLPQSSQTASMQPKQFSPSMGRSPQPTLLESDETRSSLDRDMMDDDVDEALVEQYLSEMGTEEQLVTFFDRYKNHTALSDKCALDGRYFFKVLAPYGGLVDSELFLRINQGAPEVGCGGRVHRPFEALPIAFDVNDLARTKDSPVRYRLIKFILDVGNDPADNTGGVHTNLIYIDTAKKEIVRFEPLHDEYYTEKTNEILRKYFAKLLPDYSYRMLNEHPQLSTTESCPSKGMCAAYVLKKAMMLVTGHDYPLNRDPKLEELKIMQFADAIETEYGELPSDEDAEHGLVLGFSPAPYVSPFGPNAFYGPNVLPYSYGPEYYGFLRGPRFARPPGYGFGRYRHRHWGNLGRQETGVWADLNARLHGAYSKAKQHVQKLRGRKSSRSGFGGRGRGNRSSSPDRRREHGRYPHNKPNRGNRSKSSVRRSEFGDMSQPHRTGDYHVHYHGCGCEGCQAAPPRDQRGYWGVPPSYSSPQVYTSSPQTYYSPGRSASLFSGSSPRLSGYDSPLDRTLPTATPAYSSPAPFIYGSPRFTAPEMMSPSQWNPVPPSRITIDRSPTGGASLTREVTQESSYIDPVDGQLVNLTRRTTVPLEGASLTGEFGCGCNVKKATAESTERREENGVVLNTVGGAVLGTLVAGPLGTIAGGAAGYALSNPSHGKNTTVLDRREEGSVHEGWKPGAAGGLGYERLREQSNLDDRSRRNNSDRYSGFARDDDSDERYTPRRQEQGIGSTLAGAAIGTVLSPGLGTLAGGYVGYELGKDKSLREPVLL